MLIIRLHSLLRLIKTKEPSTKDIFLEDVFLACLQGLKRGGLFFITNLEVMKQNKSMKNS